MMKYLFILVLTLTLLPAYAKPFRLFNYCDRGCERLYQAVMFQQSPACNDLKKVVTRYRNENKKIDTSSSEFLLAMEKCKPGIVASFYQQKQQQQLLNAILLGQSLQYDNAQRRKNRPIILLNSDSLNPDHKHPHKHNDILFPGIDYIPLND